MAYHEGFWLAAAAAGPVIALSFVVAVERSLNDATQGLPARRKVLDLPHWVLTGEKRYAGRPARQPDKAVTRRWVLAVLLATAPYAIAVVGFGIAALTTTDALECLGAKCDKYTTFSIKAAIAIDLGLLLAHQFASVVIRLSFRWTWPEERGTSEVTPHHPTPGPRRPAGTQPPAE